MQGTSRRACVQCLLLPTAAAFQAGVAPQQRVAALNARTAVTGGNWKMNPTTLDEATELAKGLLTDTASIPGEAIVFPPFPFLGPVGDILKGSKVQLGAQSIFFEDKGAFTGAVSSCMVKSMGVTYVLAGHSERRCVFKDDDTAINKKVLKIIDAGMIPVLCIGETKEEYDANLVTSVCAIQLAKDLAGVSAEDMKKIVIAYEPVWAIGTGLVCPSDTAQEVHKFIRSKLSEMYSQEVADAVRIQYGGSVTPDSVDELMSMPDIDGCLVGGASLDAGKFSRILNFKA